MPGNQLPDPLDALAAAELPTSLTDQQRRESEWIPTPEGCDRQPYITGRTYCATHQQGQGAWPCVQAALVHIANLDEVARAARAFVDDEPCRGDHEGYCQTHGVSKPCSMALLRAALARLDQGRVDGIELST